MAKKLNQANVRKCMTIRAKKLGFEKPLHPHAFRHTFSHELVRENMNPRYIQDLLGHASLATTDKYLRSFGSYEAVELIKHRV